MRYATAVFLLAITSACVRADPPAPLPLPVNSQANTVRQLDLYRASPRTIRASFTDGAAAMNLTGVATNNLFLTWSPTTTSAIYAASSPLVYNATNGQVDFTFAASNLNYTPGRYVYEVGIGSTVVRQGVLVIQGSPFASGASAVNFSTSVNWGVVNWVGLPDFVEDVASDGTIYGRSNGQWVAVASATPGATNAIGAGRLTLSYTGSTRTIHGSVDVSGLATGTPIYVETGTGTLVAASLAGYATGTPIYVDLGATNASGAGRITLSYTAATRTVHGSVDVSGLATGTPIYVETGTGTLIAASLAGYATGTPLYVETGTGTLVAASLAGYATGTPIYVDLGATNASGAGRITLSYTAATRTVHGSVDVSGLATGTPVYSLSGYATGTPLYVETGTGTLIAASLAGYATGTPIYTTAALETNVSARLDSNVWAAADSTTNYVRRTGDTIGGPIVIGGAGRISDSSDQLLISNLTGLASIRLGDDDHIYITSANAIYLSAPTVFSIDGPVDFNQRPAINGTNVMLAGDTPANIATSGQWNAIVSNNALSVGAGATNFALAVGAGATNLALAVGAGSTNIALAVGAGATSLVASVSNALTLVDGADRTNSIAADAALSNLALAAYGYASNNGAAAWSSSSATQTVNFGSQSGTNIAAFRFNTSTSGAPDRGTLRVTNGTTLAFTGASGVERPVAVLGENLNINQYQTTANAQNAATNYVRWMGSSAPTSGTANGNAWEVVPHTATSILFRVGTSNRWFVIPGYYMP